MFGQKWNKIGHRFGPITAIAQVKHLMRSLPPPKTANKPLNIVFLTILGGHFFTINVEILLAIILRLRGHKIRFVLDDCILPINEHHLVGQEDQWQKISVKDYIFGKSFIKSLGFEILRLSDLIKDKKKIDLNDYTHIIESSLLKHYRVGVLDPSLENYTDKVQLIEKSVKIIANVGLKLVEFQPDRVIMSHGIYSTWGPAREILNLNDIAVITYAETKTRDTLKFNWKKSSDIWDVEEEWIKVKNVQLTKEEEKSIDEYLETRIDHREDIRVYNFGGLESKDALYERLKIDKSKTVFTLFTNVLWDAASAQKELVYNNAIEWVLDTIDWFRYNPSSQLIIKIHPAETVIGTRQPFVNIIRNHVSNIPENIKIINPNEKINSWSIYTITDIGIVHTSTPGLELPLLGKPCIVVSDVYFRDKGFTIDITSKEEYYSKLMNFDFRSFDSEKTAILAKRFAYLIFKRYSLPFPFLESYKHHNNVISWKCESIDSIMDNVHIRFLMDAIEIKSSFIY